jgi:WXXGXW repeat (2 copies)
MTRPWLAAALIAGAALLSGCSAPGATTATGYPAVPPPRPEVIPKPPVTATPLLWQPGYWNWAGGGYVWEPGRYVPRDGHSNMFMPGWWKQTPSGYQWQPAHWL